MMDPAECCETPLTAADTSATTTNQSSEHSKPPQHPTHGHERVTTLQVAPRSLTFPFILGPRTSPFSMVLKMPPIK